MYVSLSGYIGSKCVQNTIKEKSGIKYCAKHKNRNYFEKSYAEKGGICMGHAYVPDR